MLRENSVMATLAVTDLEAARTFYSDTLGLKLAHEDEGGITYESGDSQLYVYPSTFAGTNKATAATWKVDDVDEVAKSLKEKGVGFEHFEMPQIAWEGDVAVMGGWRSAWFKDPTGNILAIGSRAND